jgi:hypothetical protein
MIKHNSIPIFHIASIARSGETILMRNLSAHPNVKIVHNFRSFDTFTEQKMYKSLKKRARTEISRFNLFALPYKLNRGDVLVLKQGVWKHPYAFKGFILARNPLSIFSSLRSYDEKYYDISVGKTPWDLTLSRLKRWLGDIDKAALDGFETKTPIEQFSTFYNTRMKDLLSTNLPIVKYEELVTSPRRELTRVQQILDLDIHEDVFNAEKKFDKGFQGHGFSDFSKRLNSNSLRSYEKKLSQVEITQLSDLTASVAKEIGY